MVVDYSAATGPTTSPFYSCPGKSSPVDLHGTSCSSGDDDSCGSGGSLRVTTAAVDYGEALRCRYGDDMPPAASSSSSAAAAAAGLSERHPTTLTLGPDAGDDVVDVSAEFDDDNERHRHSSSTGTHRKHKAQKQVRAAFLHHIVVFLFCCRPICSYWLNGRIFTSTTMVLKRAL